MRRQVEIPTQRQFSLSKPKAGKKGETRSSERGTKEGGKGQKGASKFQKKDNKAAGPKAPQSGGCFICGGPHFAKDYPENASLRTMHKRTLA